jgi:hypothetical protein
MAAASERTSAPNILRRFVDAFNRAIGIDDPDLRHGRIGPMESDEKIRDAEDQTVRAGRNCSLDSSQPE